MIKVTLQFPILFLTGILCFQSVFAQKTSQNWTNKTDFCLSDKSGLTTIWGSGEAIPGVYFDEWLPAFFKRKLSLTESELNDSTLQWMFTGEDGGATVTITADSVKLEQRYYDSFGFNKVENRKIKAERSKRYPQYQFTAFKTALDGRTIKSISMEVNHGLGLKFFINDSLINEQTTQIDFSRHQLQLNGKSITFCGKLKVPAISDVKITLDPSEKHQEILGFGGITSPVAYNMLSAEGQEKWWDFLKEYNLLIQREYPMGQKLKEDYSNWDKLDEATPHYYGDNFPNGEVSDFGYNKKIQQMGGMVVFEFWKFPEWMVNKSESEEEDSNAVPLYDKYTAAIVDYCKTAKQKTGKAPAIVGIQNEVTQLAEVWQQMTLSLRKALDKNGFDKVKIHMHNGNSLKNGIKALKAFTADKKVWNDIDYTAANLYDHQNYFTDPDGYDNVIAQWNKTLDGQPKKPFISTEMCINAPEYQSGSYRVAFLMGELYHKNMVDLDAVSLIYCWLLINNTQPSFSVSRSLFTIDKSRNMVPEASSFQLRVFGAFSRHLSQGAQRIGVSSSDPDLLVSAYAKGNKNTVIVLNRSNEPKRIDLAALGTVDNMELVSPYRENKQVKMTDEKQVVIAPGSIVTFY